MPLKPISKLTCILLLLAVVGCSGINNYRPFPPNADLQQFEAAFDFIETDYIEPMSPRILVGKALDGLRAVPGAPQPQTEAILSQAQRKIAELADPTPTQLKDGFAEAFHQVRALPGSPLDAPLLQSALSAMVAGLVEDSSFTPKPTPGANPRSKGSVGLAFSHDGGRIRIIYILAGSLAGMAGVRSGDELVSVDGHPVANLSLEATAALLNGPVGSGATLSLQRAGEPLTVQVVRSEVSAGAVAAERVDGAAYIRVGSFQSGTTRSVRNTLRGLDREKTSPLTGIILDLRYNTGGLWAEAIGFAGALLPPGKLVADVKTRRPADDQHITSSGGDIAEGRRIVVLANKTTGSGAEVVAAALQSNHRAVVMGSTTAGQGDVATVVPLRELGLLRIPTGRLMLADRKPLTGHGVIPDETLPARPAEPFVPGPSISSSASASMAEILGRALRPGESYLSPEQPTSDKQVQAAAAFLRYAPRQPAS